MRELIAQRILPNLLALDSPQCHYRSMGLTILEAARIRLLRVVDADNQYVLPFDEIGRQVAVKTDVAKGPVAEVVSVDPDVRPCKKSCVS